MFFNAQTIDSTSRHGQLLFDYGTHAWARKRVKEMTFPWDVLAGLKRCSSSISIWHGDFSKQTAGREKKSSNTSIQKSKHSIQNLKYYLIHLKIYAYTTKHKRFHINWVCIMCKHGYSKMCSSSPSWQKDKKEHFFFKNIILKRVNFFVIYTI